MIRVDRIVHLCNGTRGLWLELDLDVIERNRQAVEDGADGAAFDPEVFKIHDRGELTVWLSATDLALFRVAIAELLEKFADEQGEDWTPGPDPFLEPEPERTVPKLRSSSVLPGRRTDDGPPV